MKREIMYPLALIGASVMVGILGFILKSFSEPKVNWNLVSITFGMLGVLWYIMVKAQNGNE